MKVIFGDFFFASILAAQLAIAIPLAINYSQAASSDARIHGWFLWTASVLSAAMFAYILAAVDYRVFNSHNVLDVFLTALVLLEVIVLMLVGSSERKKEPRISVISREDPAPAKVIPGNDVKNEETPRIVICTSSAQYADSILGIERQASRIDRMTKRVSAIFKDPQAVEAIAVERFGPGSPQAEAYRREHMERHRVFVERLAAGDLVCREIYQIEELKRYFASRLHGQDVTLARGVVRRTAQEWLRVLGAYDNYYVGLTTDPIPLKYQIYDKRSVVLHEAVGSMDGHRLNALIINDGETAGTFQGDFEHVWERIPSDMRSKRTVIGWIRSELIPLLGR